MRLAFAQVLEVLRGQVPHHVICDLFPGLHDRHEISHLEKAILLAHGRLLCPCGGSLFSTAPLPRRRAVR